MAYLIFIRAIQQKEYKYDIPIIGSYPKAEFSTEYTLFGFNATATGSNSNYSITDYIFINETNPYDNVIRNVQDWSEYDRLNSESAGFNVVEVDTLPDTTGANAVNYYIVGKDGIIDYYGALLGNALYNQENDTLSITLAANANAKLYKDDGTEIYSWNKEGYNGDLTDKVVLENFAATYGYGTYHYFVSIPYSQEYSTTYNIVVSKPEADEKIYYTVTFDSDGGTSVSSKKVEENKTVSKPSDPTKSGYTFLGWWYITDEVAGLYDFSTPVTSNFTLYAKWEQAQPSTTCFVTFSSVNILLTGKTIKKGSTVTPPSVYEREGYVFLGWSEYDYEDAPLFNFNTLIYNDITLYGVWREIGEEYCIIIPSKDIYSINNQKVRKNIIDRIDVSANAITPSNEFETSVYTETIDTTDDITTSEETDNQYADTFYVDNSSGSNVTKYVRLASGITVKKTYKKISKIKIKKAQYNKFIKKLYDTVEDIKYNITSQIKTYVADVGYSPKDNQFIFYSTNDNLINEDKLYDFNSISYFDSNTLSTEYPKIIADLLVSQQNDTLVSQANINGFYTVWNNSSLNVTSKIETQLIANTNFSISENDDYFIINNLEILIGLEINLSYAWIESTAEMSNIGTLGSDNIKSIKIETTPSKLELTIYGDTIGIDLTDTTLTLGNNSGTNPISVDNNELIQTTNYIGDKDAITKSLSEVLTEYISGKETATIVCAIDDYYDEDTGEKIITADGTNRMTFRIGDIVIPQVYKANTRYNSIGDNPMSNYRDGTPKQFKVLGVRLYWDGVVQQELTLQEI